MDKTEVIAGRSAGSYSSLFSLPFSLLFRSLSPSSYGRARGSQICKQEVALAAWYQMSIAWKNKTYTEKGQKPIPLLSHASKRDQDDDQGGQRGGPDQGGEVGEEDGSIGDFSTIGSVIADLLQGLDVLTGDVVPEDWVQELLLTRRVEAEGTLVQGIDQGAVVLADTGIEGQDLVDDSQVGGDGDA